MNISIEYELNDEPVVLELEIDNIDYQPNIIDGFNPDFNNGHTTKISNYYVDSYSVKIIKITDEDEKGIILSTHRLSELVCDLSNNELIFDEIIQ